MVTFSLPGDDNVADATNGTPRPRPPLPFAKRNGIRDDMSSSSLNSASIATARNIFRASAFSDSPSATVFSPTLPHGTIKRVFAPGATPEPTRLYRQSTAQATPRGTGTKVADKELFSMRISSPPPELTGEVLTQKIPKEWNSKGSIYADQFLAHLCPPELDEEQRRQFFCILDLRRLKYAANEIFSKKDWKLNVINFAKEFEKSRSIILLRYGLYEFQNVKPSKEVLKRWRREHGLPEPEADELEPTPSKVTAASKKRKADDDLCKDSIATSSSPLKGKRRAMMESDEREEREEPPATTPAPSKTKRKASVSEDQPAKMPKTMPSAAKSLFEKVANKPAVTAQSLEQSASSKANLFAANKSGGSSNSLARSVFTNLKPPAGQSAPSGNNIFGYLSDASSAKNSGVEADAENESETDSEGDESPEAGQSDEPSTTASGTGETGSHIGFNSFAKKPAPPTGGFGPGLSSNPDTRESTPARSLFDRVTKDSDGQPVRAEERTDALVFEKPTAAPVDQTWNPSTTPIKFAPSAPANQKNSVFGSLSATPTSSAFAPKSITAPNSFGAAKQAEPPAKESSAGTGVGEGDKDGGGESDKENESQSTRKSLLEPKAPGAQPSVGTSLLQPRPASTEAPVETQAPKPSTNLFSSATKTDSKPEMSTTANIFSTSDKTSDVTLATPSTNFSSGAKPAEAEKPAESDTPRAAPLFNVQGTSATLGNTSATTSLFATKPATAVSSSSFGSGPSTSSNPLFGTTSTFGNGSATAKTDGAAPAAAETPSKPIFGFGSITSVNPSAGTQATTSKPLFGAPKSPGPANGLFGGSPMKQDELSPAKTALMGGSNTGLSTPAFGFGNPKAAASDPSTNTFGAASASATNNSGNPTISLGAGASSNSGSGGFNFNFNGGGISGSSFNNPFVKNSNPAPGVSVGGAFGFGAAPSAPASGSSTPFQFGGAGSANTSLPSAPGGGSVFGGSQPTNNNSTPVFGGASASGGGVPMFNFSGASNQPPQGTGSGFGSDQAAPVFGSLHAPAGGSSTTGTNSPLYLGGGSSLATTPAAGTPEPLSQGADGGNAGDNDEVEKHEQINLLDGVDENEQVLHEVRAKALKFVPPGDKTDSDGKSNSTSKSPWSTQGIGPLRLLEHKETGVVRLVLRAEPRGHVVMNRALLPNMSYKADEKYVKVTTSNEKGDGLETWMVQVKTKESAKELAEALEKNKHSNKK